MALIAYVVVAMLIAVPMVFAQGIQKAPVAPGDPTKPGPKAVIKVVPATGTGSTPADYCRLGSGGRNLVVRLENVGSSEASAQQVTVTFRTKPDPTTRVRQSPVIPPGQSVDLNFALPAKCGSPDCGFSIKRANQPAIGGLCVG